MTVGRVLRIAVLFCPALLSTGMAGQIFRAQSDLVLLNATVTDQQGNPVAGLNQPDFEVFEDGEKRDISYFQQQDAPLSLAFLLDTSSSMRGAALQEARRAAAALVDSLSPDSEISLLSFDRETHLHGPFTTDKSVIKKALALLAPGGGTALYDAVLSSVRLLRERPLERKAVVVLSDGKDLDSQASYSKLQESLLTTSILFFSVGTFGPAERDLYFTGEKYFKPPELDVNLNPVWVLEEMARITGGRALFPLKDEPVDSFFVEIARELRNQYVIGFQPSPGRGESRVRRIEVRVKGKAYSVRTRTAYRVD